MQFRIRFRDLLAIAASLAALSLCVPAAAQPAEAYSPPANAEESIDNVNILVGEYPDEDRAELLLLPAIAAMDAGPPDVSTPESAAMLAPGHPSWSAARSWSEADAQKAALEALMKVGEPRTRFVFALPFGDDALSSTLRETGLTARLADGKLLAGMQLRYLEGLDRLGALANVRATALADDGDVMSAMEVLMAWLRTARSLAARPFYREVEWSLSAMTHVIERMADVAYTYDDLAPDDVRDILWEVDDRGLQLDRILFPRGDREAALQLVAAVFEPRRGPDPTQFGPTLAGLETGERPLRRFGAAGRWQKIAQTHADWFDTVEELERIYEDWMIKWSFDPFDDLLKQPFEYELADDARFAALKEVLDDMSDLFQKRIALRTTLAGSRTSLAVVGFKVQNRRLPPNLFAIRGTESGFLRALPRDPFNPDERQPLKFFVPSAISRPTSARTRGPTSSPSRPATSPRSPSARAAHSRRRRSTRSSASSWSAPAPGKTRARSSSRRFEPPPRIREPSSDNSRRKFRTPRASGCRPRSRPSPPLKSPSRTPPRSQRRCPRPSRRVHSSPARSAPRSPPRRGRRSASLSPAGCRIPPSPKPCSAPARASSSPTANSTSSSTRTCRPDTSPGAMS